MSNNIPVKAQGQTSTSPAPTPPTAPNPINDTKQLTNDQDDSDAELDNILKDVNKKVKDDDSKDGAKAQKIKAKLLSKKSKTEKTSKRPILIVVAAVLVALGLSASAVYAFKQAGSDAQKTSSTDKPSTVGTSVNSSDAVKAAGGTLVQPGDLTDLSSDLNTKLNALSDTQDFSANDLADQTLGL